MDYSANTELIGVRRSMWLSRSTLTGQPAHRDGRSATIEDETS